MYHMDTVIPLPTGIIAYAKLVFNMPPKYISSIYFKRIFKLSKRLGISKRITCLLRDYLKRCKICKKAIKFIMNFVTETKV